MLCQLRWVTAKSNRPHPKNTELTIRPREELLAELRALQGAFRRPEDFVGMVFQSSDELWVERCASIIRRPGDRPG